MMAARTDTSTGRETRRAVQEIWKIANPLVPTTGSRVWASHGIQIFAACTSLLRVLRR